MNGKTHYYSYYGAESYVSCFAIKNLLFVLSF
jgi:hypothetical protein